MSEKLMTYRIRTGRGLLVKLSLHFKKKDLVVFRWNLCLFLEGLLGQTNG